MKRNAISMVVNSILALVGAVMSLGCANGHWRATPPDESTFAPKDGTPVVKLDPPRMGLTVSVNTDSEIESYIIDRLTVEGVAPLELPIIIGALTPGVSTRKFLKVDMNEYNTHLNPNGPKKYKLHRRVKWKSGKTAEGELTGTIPALY